MHYRTKKKKMTHACRTWHYLLHSYYSWAVCPSLALAKRYLAHAGCTWVISQSRRRLPAAKLLPLPRKIISTTPPHTHRILYQYQQKRLPLRRQTPTAKKIQVEYIKSKQAIHPHAIGQVGDTTWPVKAREGESDQTSRENHRWN